MLDKILSFIADQIRHIMINLGIDRVMEEGVNDGWRYTKWANGDMEIWWSGKLSYSSFIPVYDGHRGECHLVLPFSLTEKVVISDGQSSGIRVYSDSTVPSGKDIWLYITSPNAETVKSVHTSIYVRGRWK